MLTIETIIELFAPHNCLGCALEGTILCEECFYTKTKAHPSVCVLCNALTNEFRVCKKCSGKTKLKRVWIGSRYEGLAQQLMVEYKFERKQAAHLPLADLLFEAIASNDYDFITAVPSATSRTRARGYNSAELIARKVAKKLDIPYLSTLGRFGQRRQFGASRKKRLEQLEGSFYVLSPKKIAGKKILLIDDVATTGSTLQVCAKELHKAGAKRIEAGVVAKD